MTAYLAGELDEWFCCPRPPELSPSAPADSRPRERLAAVLGAEARRLGANADVVALATRLGRPNSRAAVTGQQAGLLLGPLYTLSKSGCALSVARGNDTGDDPVVPVFWLASQDHDAAEVDHAWLFDMDERLHRLHIELPPEVPVGSVPMDPAWPAALEAGIGAGAWPAGHLDEVLQVVHAAAARADTWADFFAALYYAVLGADAPLLLDPGVPEVAALFHDVLARELDMAAATAEAINTAGATLRHAGHAPQLGRGAGATNLFLNEIVGGLPRRHLLRIDGDRFHTAAHSYSRADLLAVLAQEPGRITPAAGLRPVAQDAVLPSAAFVVGPGELRYLAQLRGVYELHGVAQPTIWPRTAVTLLEPPARRILGNYGLTAAGFAADPAGALDRVLLERSGASDAFERAVAALEAQQTELERSVAAIDPTLTGTVARHAERVRSSTTLLRGKAAAALARRDGDTTRQFSRLGAALLPAGAPQERVISPFSFFLKFGVEPVARMFRNLPPEGDITVEI